MSPELQLGGLRCTLCGMAQAKKRTMSPEHKQAIAEGREQSKVVATYLEALEANRPKRGRKRTPASIDKQLADVDDKLASANPISRLQLIQDRMDLAAAKEALESDVDLSTFEDDFVEVASPYSERKGITPAAWRELGVPAAVLKRAGIGRAGR